MLIPFREAPTFTVAGATARGYASPARGARDTSLWRITLDAGARSPAHSLTREEVFLGLSGRAVADIGGERFEVGAGDCLIVPPGAPFWIEAGGEEPFEAVACLPVGGEATFLPDGPTTTPPWAA